MCCFWLLFCGSPLHLLRQRDRDKETFKDVYQQDVTATHTHTQRKKKKRATNKFGGGKTIKWAVENGKMAARRAMPDGGKRR